MEEHVVFQFKPNIVIVIDMFYNVFMLRTIRFRLRLEDVPVPLRLVDKNIVCFFFFFSMGSLLASRCNFQPNVFFKWSQM